MPVGFHDDATFRWGVGAAADLDRASAAQASVIRTIADWRAIAPTRPRKATDSFDPAYTFGNLDDLVRNAQRRGLQVMITIWGTPRWANGGDGPNVAPTRAGDMADFGRAIADRYSGRHAGFPHVGRYSIWNEPNLEIFLAPPVRPERARSPAHEPTPRSTGPATRVSRRETPRRSWQSARRRIRGATGRAKGATADSVAPGTFARLLAREPNLSFDAYATHPYPTRPDAPPTERVRWPNVTLSQLPRFEESLDRWFKRRDIPIWITEYGYQTKPGDRFGVTEAQQARYLSLVMNQLRADQRVQMFIWFIFRDSKRGLWQSGLTTASGRTKPSYSAFLSLARSMGGQTVKIKPGVKPTIKLPVPTARIRLSCRLDHRRHLSRLSRHANGRRRPTCAAAPDQPVRQLRCELHAGPAQQVHDRDRRRRHQRQPRPRHLQPPHDSHPECRNDDALRVPGPAPPRRNRRGPHGDLGCADAAPEQHSRCTRLPIPRFDARSPPESGSRICCHDLRLSRRGDASADRRSLRGGGDLHHRVRVHPRRSDARHRRERAARLDRRSRLDPRPPPLRVCRDVRAVRGRGPARRRQRQPGARPRRRGRDLRRERRDDAHGGRRSQLRRRGWLCLHPARAQLDRAERRPRRPCSSTGCASATSPRQDSPRPTRS